MVRKLASLGMLCLLVLCYPVLSDTDIWLGTRQELVRFNTKAGQVDQSIALPDAADLATDGSGALWVLTSTEVSRFPPPPAQRTDWTLSALGIPNAKQLRVDPYDNTAWLFNGQQIVHVNDAGKPLATIGPGLKITDFALALDESLWTLEGSRLVHYSAEAKATRSIDLPPTVADAEHLVVDSLHNVIWLRSATRITQLDLLSGAEKQHAAPPSDTRSAVLDPVSGTLWILTPTALTGLAIDGTIEQLDLRPAGISSAEILAYDGTTASLWVADRSAITKVRLATHDESHYALDDEPVLIAAPPLVLLPSITPRGLEGTEKKGLPSVDFGLDVLCFGLSCEVPRDYFSGLSFDATVAGTQVGQYVVVDPDLKRAKLTVPGALIRSSSLFAQATDSFGHQSNVIGDMPGTAQKANTDKTKSAAASTPTVSITSPASGAGFLAPANITVTATASSSGHTITKVQFYQGSTLIGTATAAPYTISWSNVATGAYSLTAKATDNANSTGTSSAVSIKVYTPPTVSITAPANNATYSAPASISITASASDTNATISQVNFYNGSTLLGSKTSSPYTYSWTNVAAGSYTLTAKATNNFGSSTTSSPVAVAVRGKPVVSITAPTNGASFNAPASITISASASEINGTISKVDFYRGSTLLGTSTTAPYSFTWNNVAAGSYSLTAKATDTSSVSTTSSAVSVAVVVPHYPPSVSITAPASGTTYTAPASIPITASASETNGTINKVDFYQGSTLIGTSSASPYGVSWSNVAAGSYSLTAVATDTTSVQSTSSPVSIIVYAPPVISITSPSLGALFGSPATVNLLVSVSGGNGGISRVDYYNGSTLIGSSTSSPFSYSWGNVPSGSYNIVAKATDAQGIVGTSTPVYFAIDSTDTCAQQIGQASPTGTAPAFGNVARTFEPNVGQAPADVAFLSRRGSSEILIRSSGIEFVPGRQLIARDAKGRKSPAPVSTRLNLVGSSATVNAAGLDRVAEVSNYLLGRDASTWKTGVPHYKQVQIEAVYPGIDEVFYDNGGQLEYDFTVAPGADPGRIRIGVEGTYIPSIGKHGELLLRNSTGQLIQRRPVAYQKIGNSRRNVQVAYAVDDRGQITFHVGNYDRRQALVIDPVLIYSTYFGNGTSYTGIAVDHCGEVVVVGTAPGGFPTTPGAYSQVAPSYASGFVAKLNPSGSGLVYSTYFGGTTYESYINAVGVDMSGHAYFVGTTYASDFPITGGAFDTSRLPTQINAQAFAAKLSPDGAALLYSTYLGGSGGVRSGYVTNSDVATSIAVDGNGYAFIAGYTFSDDFPVTAGVYQSTKAMANAPTLANAFVTKLNPTGSGLVYSTYVGGASTNPDNNNRVGDFANAITVDPAGNAYVGGETTSEQFPVTTGAYITDANTYTYSGNGDRTFLFKLNSSGSGLFYSSYFLGSKLRGVAVDAAGSVYAAGSTGEPVQVPGSIYVFDPSSLGIYGVDAYISKLKPDGSGIYYWTVWGAPNCTGGGCYSTTTVANSIVVDASGSAIVAGTTDSSSLPTARPIRSFPNTVGAFATKVSPTGSAFVYSTPLTSISGVSNYTEGDAVAIDADGVAYVVGVTTASDFPVTAGAYQTTGQAGASRFGYVAKISDVRDTLTALSLDHTSVLVTQPVTLTATVSGHSPSGIVTFFDGSMSIGSAPLVSGIAALTSSTWTDGAHTLTAAYGGDSKNDGSVSAATTINVGDPFTLPTVSITNPTDGSVFVNQGSGYTPLITVHANAAAGSTITRFDLYQDHADLGYVTPNTTTAGYTYTGSNYTAGTHVYFATAIDSFGNTVSSSPVRISINSSADAPTIAMTAPTDGTTVQAGGQVSLSAIATPPIGGTIQHILFYQDGALIDQENSPSASLVVSNLQQGSHTFFAVAYDNNSNSGISSLVHVSVPAPATPKVYIYNPINWAATYYVPAAIPISAIAEGVNGSTVSKVDFYANGALIGTTTAPPYLFNWTATTPAQYAITAVVTDSNGLTATSKAVNEQVLSPDPRVAIDSPSSGTSMSAPSSVTISALAFAIDGVTVTKVDFYVGSSLLGTTTTPPYSVTWNATQPGSYTLSAVVTDSNGRTATSSPVYVEVGSSTSGALGISITFPTNYSYLAVPAQANVTTSVYAGSGASIAQVDFFSGDTLIATVYSLPYSYTWNVPAPGGYSIYARVTDTNGLTANSNTVNFDVDTNGPPTVQVTNVHDGALISDDNTVISGTVHAPLNSTVTVGGVTATVANDGTFFLNNVPVNTTATPIQVTVADQDGNTASTSLSLTSTGPAPFSIYASPTEGLAPLAVDFFAHNNGVAFTEIDLKCFGEAGPGGYTTLSLSPDGSLGTCGYTTPGLYSPTILVLNAPDGATPQVVYYGKLNVYVHAASDLDAKLKGVILQTFNRLQSNNTTGALNLFSNSSRDQYTQIFAGIGANLPGFISQIGTPDGGLFNEDIAQYSLIRDGTQTGDPAYNVYLIRGADGIWRIDGL